jgi:hypothetical protein
MLYVALISYLLNEPLLHFIKCGLWRGRGTGAVEQVCSY